MPFPGVVTPLRWNQRYRRRFWQQLGTGSGLWGPRPVPRALLPPHLPRSPAPRWGAVPCWGLETIVLMLV